MNLLLNENVSLLNTIVRFRIRESKQVTPSRQTLEARRVLTENVLLRFTRSDLRLTTCLYSLSFRQKLVPKSLCTCLVMLPCVARVEMLTVRLKNHLTKRADKRNDKCIFHVSPRKLINVPMVVMIKRLYIKFHASSGSGPKPSLTKPELVL